MIDRFFKNVLCTLPHIWQTFFLEADTNIGPAAHKA